MLLPLEDEDVSLQMAIRHGVLCIFYKQLLLLTELQAPLSHRVEIFLSFFVVLESAFSFKMHLDGF